MANWQEGGPRFVNPYNFLTTGGKCNKNINGKKLRKEKKLMSGMIDCTLTTTTPMFIPNVSNEDGLNIKVKDHKSYDFFSYEDLKNVSYNSVKEPIVPGSSIRGVVRSTYEALTNSCFSVVDDERILYKRMPDPGTPCVIKRENGKLKIYKTERINICTENYKSKDVKTKKITPRYVVAKEGDYEDCEKVFVNKSQGRATKIEKKQTSDCRYLGYVINGGKISNKNSFGVILSSKHGKDAMVFVNDRDLDRLEQAVKLYQDDSINKTNADYGFREYEKYLKTFRNDCCEGAEIPAFYKKVGDKIYLSPSCITKEVYDNTINTILKNNMGGYDPCENIEKLCEACELFGMVGENEAISSKLRFTDGRIENLGAKVFGEIITLKELASPKISSTEFYMEDPSKENQSINIWTYDYAAKWKERAKEKINFTPKLRGRKFYWHHSGINNATTKDQNLRNVTIRPVKEDVKFKFSVFFERITEEQLEKIIWTLTLGDNKKDSNMQCKIGMGKPLGLGSVKITVDDVKERIIDLENFNYKYNDLDCINKLDNIENKFDKDLVKNIKIAYNKNSVKANIMYPIGKTSRNVETTFVWFAGNKCFNGGTGTKPIINKALPDIRDKDLSLPRYNENNKW